MPLNLEKREFLTTVEIVPPAGADAGPLLDTLQSLRRVPFDAFSVATNPIARPRLSALALSSLIQQRTGRPAIMHCTTRDHNFLSLQSLLWGARALGIETVLVASGDYISLGDLAQTTTVHEVDVFSLVRMARAAGLHAGVVLDPRSDGQRRDHEMRRLQLKVEAGAEFVVTQPIYSIEVAEALADAARSVDIPILIGILPLRSERHARFLHQKVAGIHIPQPVIERMGRAADPVQEGLATAREMLEVARDLFAGACIMPPFDHYDLVQDVLPLRQRSEQAAMVG